MIPINDTLDLIVLLRDLFIDHPTDVTLVTYTALDPPLETQHFQSTLLLLDTIQDQEILDLLDHVHAPTQVTKFTQSNQKHLNSNQL